MDMNSFRHFCDALKDRFESFENTGIGKNPSKFRLKYNFSIANSEAVYEFAHLKSPKDNENLFYLNIKRGVHTDLWLDSMQAHPPGQGVGTIVIKELTELADKTSVKIALRSVPRGSSYEQRSKWLSNHNFKDVGDGTYGDATHVRFPSNQTLFNKIAKAISRLLRRRI